jgi:hypothetical protein
MAEFILSLAKKAEMRIASSFETAALVETSFNGGREGGHDRLLT